MISIQRQLMTRLCAAMLLLAAIWGVGLYVYVRNEAIEQFDDALLVKSQTLGSLMRQQDDGRYSMEYSDESAAEFAPGTDAEYFQIIWPGHGTIERSRSLAAAELVNPAAAEKHAKIWNLTLPDGRRGRAIGRFVKPTPERFDRNENPATQRPPLLSPDPMLVIVAVGRDELDEELHRLAASLWIGCSLLAPVSLLLIGPLVRRVLRPVNNLAEDAQQMGPATLNDRFDASRLPKELQPIGGALNGLLDRLHAAFTREKRVNADIAHELRTPIAELKTLSEVALRQPGLSDRNRVYFSDAKAIALRMSRLLQSLSLLGQSQSAAVPVTIKPINLAAMIETALRAQQPAIERRELTIEKSLAADLTVCSDDQLLRRVVENLIDNAISHGDADGPIRISASQDGAAAMLRISNADHTLDASHLPLMFEPFWQKSAARSDVEHAGLGLSLVQNYARLLDIEIDARLPESGRVEFTLRMMSSKACGCEPINDQSPQLMSHGL